MDFPICLHYEESETRRMIFCSTKIYDRIALFQSNNLIQEITAKDGSMVFSDSGLAPDYNRRQ